MNNAGQLPNSDGGMPAPSENAGANGSSASGSASAVQPSSNMMPSDPQGNQGNPMNPGQLMNPQVSQGINNPQGNRQGDIVNPQASQGHNSNSNSNSNSNNNPQGNMNMPPGMPPNMPPGMSMMNPLMQLHVMQQMHMPFLGMGPMGMMGMMPGMSAMGGMSNTNNNNNNQTSNPPSNQNASAAGPAGRPQQGRDQPPSNNPMDPSNNQQANLLSLLQQQQAAMQFNPMAAMMMGGMPWGMNPMQFSGFGDPAGAMGAGGGPAPSGGMPPYAGMPANVRDPRCAPGVPAEIDTGRGTAAGGKLGGKKNPKKKIKGKPKRPLSAYNLFFKDERERILNAIPKREEESTNRKISNTGSDDSERTEEDNQSEEDKFKHDDEARVKTEEDGKAKQEGTEDPTADESNKDSSPTKQPKDSTPSSPKDKDWDQMGKNGKKIPHGKIGFESLAKLIGKRWQELDAAEVDKYKKLADEDAKRYKAEMELFLTRDSTAVGNVESGGEGQAAKRAGFDGGCGVGKKQRVEEEGAADY